MEGNSKNTAAIRSPSTIKPWGMGVPRLPQAFGNTSQHFKAVPGLKVQPSPNEPLHWQLAHEQRLYPPHCSEDGAHSQHAAWSPSWLAFGQGSQEARKPQPAYQAECSTTWYMCRNR